MNCWRAKNHLTPCCSTEMALLNTPEIYQKGPYDCGRASALIVLGFYGVVGADADRLIATLPVDPHDGTDPLQMSTWFRSIGWGCCEGTMDIGTVKHHGAEGRPVILLYQNEHGGHWAVSRGVSRGTIYLQDPNSGRSKMPVAAFEAAWWDNSRHGARFRQWGIVGVPV